MRALSLSQPWASLVARGYKPIENRKWRLPHNMLGEDVVIHSAKKYDHEGHIFLERNFKGWGGVDQVLKEGRGANQLPMGYLLSVHRIAGYLDREKREWVHRRPIKQRSFLDLATSVPGGVEAFYEGVFLEGPIAEDWLNCPLAASPWFFGKFGFILEAPRQLSEPIKCKGALSFWHVPEKEESDVRRQLA